MYLRKAHGYIIGALGTGFHFTGTAVPVSPDWRFPMLRIHGFRTAEYSKTIYQYTKNHLLD